MQSPAHPPHRQPLSLPTELWRRVSALGKVRSDLLLQNFLDDDFQVGAAAPLDQGSGAIDDQFLESALNQRRQLESSTKLLNDHIALESFNHARPASR